MAGSIGGDLREKIENPLKFQWGSGGGDTPRTTVNGFDTSLLIDICNAIIAAEATGSLKAARYAKLSSKRISLLEHRPRTASDSLFTLWLDIALQQKKLSRPLIYKFKRRSRNTNLNFPMNFICTGTVFTIFRYRIAASVDISSI